MDLMQTPVAIVLVSKFGYTQGILVFTAISSALAGASKVAEPWHGSGAAEQLAVHAPGRGDEETGWKWKRCILVFTAISPRWRARTKIAEPWHGSGAAEQLAVHAPAEATKKRAGNGNGA